MTATMTGCVEIKGADCNGHYRVGCVVCGQSMKTSWGRTPTLFCNGEEIGDVCDPCIKDGPDAIKKRLLEHAEGLRKHAECLTAWASMPIRGITSEEELEALYKQNEELFERWNTEEADPEEPEAPSSDGLLF